MALDLKFIGIDTQYPLANGELKPRIHLDGAASPLVMQKAIDAIETLLPHYSNSHSFSHASARISSSAFKWSMNKIMQAVEANEDYQCAFMGSGSTAWLNNVARRLAGRKNTQGKVCDIVLVSALEHHANDLPHRKHSTVKHFGLIQNQDNHSSQLGDIDLQDLELKLKKYSGRVNYVTFSAVSNVTGIINPIQEITRLAHQHGVYSVVDCAQMAAHMPLSVAKNNADFVIFSGHKVYAGAAPGVLIAKQSLLAKHPSDEMGGGIVETVAYLDEVFTNDFPTRELPGTKNVLGAYALGNVMKTLENIGFDNIQIHSEKLWQYAFKTLNGLKNNKGEALINIYAKSKSSRLGALAFNLKNIDHGLVAAILSDYYGIAVRNECFCAHPYVSSLLKDELWELDLDQIPDEDHEALINRKRGMLRASFSLYNNQNDIDQLAIALKDIANNIDDFTTEYIPQLKGDYVHKQFKVKPEDYLSVE